MPLITTNKKSMFLDFFIPYFCKIKPKIIGNNKLPKRIIMVENKKSTIVEILKKNSSKLNKNKLMS